MTLRIPAAARDLIVADCLQRRPIEACGVVSGLGRVVPMANTADSDAYYAFGFDEQLRVWQELDAAGDRVDVIYHSHTASPAAPSATDVRYAAYSGAHYLIVGLADPDAPEFRSWRIVDGRASEEPVELS